MNQHCRKLLILLLSSLFLGLAIPLYPASDSPEIDETQRLLKEKDDRIAELSKQVELLQEQNEILKSSFENSEQTIENLRNEIARLKEDLGVMKLPQLVKPMEEDDKSVEEDASTDEPEPVYFPGAVLSVYKLSGHKKKAETNIPGVPPVGSFIDKGELFYFNRYRDDDSLDKLFGEKLGILWTGYFEVKESAEHTLSLVINMKNRDRELNGYAKVIIDGMEVFEGSVRSSRYRDRETALPLSELVDLTAGYHKIEVWMSQFDYNFDARHQFFCEVSIKGPKDTLPVRLTRGTVFYTK